MAVPLVESSISHGSTRRDRDEPPEAARRLCRSWCDVPSPFDMTLRGGCHPRTPGSMLTSRFSQAREQRPDSMPPTLTPGVTGVLPTTHISTPQPPVLKFFDQRDVRLETCWQDVSMRHCSHLTPSFGTPPPPCRPPLRPAPARGNGSPDAFRGRPSEGTCLSWPGCR